MKHRVADVHRCTGMRNGMECNSTRGVKMYQCGFGNRDRPAPIVLCDECARRDPYYGIEHNRGRFRDWYCFPVNPPRYDGPLDRSAWLGDHLVSRTEEDAK